MILLLACTDPDKTPPADTDTDTNTDDTGTIPDGPVTMAAGDVADMVATDTNVSIELTEPGTYIVLLVSTDKAQDTFYGYGESADSAALTEPGVPFAPPPVEPLRREPVDAAVGDQRTFRVHDGTSWQTVDAEVTAVGDGVVVWTDMTTPNGIGAVEQETIDGVIESFSTIVMPRERQVFGEESDVDGDSAVQVLLSYTVNMYGPVAYVTWCDIGVDADACANDNGGEIIYMGYPDPSSRYSSVNAITETFAHEINHLIYAWHKYALNDQGSGENAYLTEGMSALAQDLSGYNNGNQYVWASALDTVDFYGGDENYSIQGVSYNDFLRGRGSYDAVRDGPLRGAAYLFFRYLFEQAGGFTVERDGTLVDAGGMAFLHTYFDAPETGVAAVEAVTGRTVEDIAMDWYTALLVTGRVENDNAAWNYQDRKKDPITEYSFGIDPFDTINGHLELTGPRVQAWDTADGQIRAGGVEYLELTVAEAGVVSLDVSADAKARARILRVE